MSGGDREKLRLFVATSRRRLGDLLERLNWSEQGVMEAKSGHILEHKAETVEPLPDSCCFNPAFSVQLDDASIQQIVGTDAGQPSGANCFEDLQVALNAPNRLLIYEHVLRHTAKHPQFEDNAAFAELVGETKREGKKQRRHRKSKPTLNEELHQLVSLQMQALQRQWEQERARKQERKQREREHRKREQEHRSREQEHRSRDQEHRTKEQQHRTREWEHRHSGSRRRSRSRSPEKQRHGHRRREERKPHRHHHSYTSGY
ncbi:matrix metalloproteinase-2 [Drosophila subpulchrella]|uniref:matrix metalloproteinase-2 n=1 Tax=Drosophila subpulchrella TaxID=1486046 RepID=UPI0018A131E7|nr:matrix metalloproteinase-2 [Drosophila subpulchrella]